MREGLESMAEVAADEVKKGKFKGKGSGNGKGSKGNRATSPSRGMPEAPRGGSSLGPPSAFGGARKCKGGGFTAKERLAAEAKLLAARARDKAATAEVERRLAEVAELEARFEELKKEEKAAKKLQAEALAELEIEFPKLKGVNVSVVPGPLTGGR